MFSTLRKMLPAAPRLFGGARPLAPLPPLAPIWTYGGWTNTALCNWLPGEERHQRCNFLLAKGVTPFLFGDDGRSTLGVQKILPEPLRIAPFAADYTGLVWFLLLVRALALRAVPEAGGKRLAEGRNWDGMAVRWLALLASGRQLLPKWPEPGPPADPHRNWARLEMLPWGHYLRVPIRKGDSFAWAFGKLFILFFLLIPWEHVIARVGLSFGSIFVVGPQLAFALFALLIDILEALVPLTLDLALGLSLFLLSVCLFIANTCMGIFGGADADANTAFLAAAPPRPPRWVWNATAVEHHDPPHAAAAAAAAANATAAAPMPTGRWAQQLAAAGGRVEEGAASLRGAWAAAAGAAASAAGAAAASLPRVELDLGGTTPLEAPAPPRTGAAAAAGGRGGRPLAPSDLPEGYSRMVADFKEKLPTGDGVILRETIGRHKPRKGNAAEEAEGPKPIMGQPWWGGLHSFLSPPWIYVTLALLRTVLVG